MTIVQTLNEVLMQRFDLHLSDNQFGFRKKRATTLRGPRIREVRKYKNGY
jgi:hypothetical protein